MNKPARSRESSTARFDVRLHHDQRVPLRDGIAASADVYLPRANGPFPTVVQWTPYESSRDQNIDWAVWYAQRGFAAVVQDVRGRYESEGIFTPYHRDGVDARDSLDWLASQRWCNGRIGTWGRSYGAIVQWQLAPLGHPALICMAPHVIADDYFADYHYLGGAFQLGLSLGAALVWATSMGTVTHPSARQHVLSERVLRHLPLVDMDTEAIGRQVGYWRDWLAHPTDDLYWQSVRHTGRYDRVDVPVFQQSGWYDAYAGSTLRAFTELRNDAPSGQARPAQRVVVGPWTHQEDGGRILGDVDFGPSAERFIRNDDLRWFDQWLKELDTGIDEEPPLSIFVMGANRWRHEDVWPLPETRLVPYYLHSRGRANTARGDGTLSLDAPAHEPADQYVYDPHDPTPTVGGNNSLQRMMGDSWPQVRPGPVDQAEVERREDVLCYTSRPLEQDLEVAGPIEAVLHAASSGLDTDFVVRLMDVHPTGRAILISEGIVRARYRYGFDRQVLLEPEEPDTFTIRCAPTGIVFRRGHRLRVHITSSSFPRFSRNLNSGEDVATGTRARVVRQTILHSSAHPSHIVLPVVPS